jgi:RNA polymerase sigma factor FliA
MVKPSRVVSPEASPLALERFHASLDLVEALARQVRRNVGPSVELDELISLGREGLLTAARRYDETREVPFRAYASFRVRGAMIDGVRRMSHLPRRVHQRLRVLSAGAEYSENAAPDLLGPAPAGESREDAARLLNDHLAGMATAMAAGLVAKTAFGDDGERTAVAHDKSPEELTENAQLRSLLDKHVAELPHEEQELVRRHYFEGERFDIVAEQLGLSKSWASRLHTRAIGRLSKRLRGLE